MLKVRFTKVHVGEVRIINDNGLSITKKGTNLRIEPMLVISRRLPAQGYVPVKVNDLGLIKELLSRSWTRTLKSFRDGYSHLKSCELPLRHIHMVEI